MEYTAIFGPITENDIKSGRMKIQFMNMNITPEESAVMVQSPPRPKDEKPKEQLYQQANAK